jgi:hypothetical protein
MLNEIKSKLIQLSSEHKSIGDQLDDYKDSDSIELQAEQLIIDYCESCNYLVDGFPTEKRKLPEEELEEDYFRRERFQYYLDVLAIQKDDVAELMWCYVSHFWSDMFENQAEYLEGIQDNLDSGVFYDVTI